MFFKWIGAVAFMKDVFLVKDVYKLCSLSRRQLRYYEDMGLIGDVMRDPYNNYRYYTREQVLLLNHIRELRSIGFSINEIARMINNESIQGLRNSIKRKISHIQIEFGAVCIDYNRKLDTLVKILDATWVAESRMEATVNDGIEIVDVPSKNVMAYDYIGCYYDDITEYLEKYKLLDDEIGRTNTTKISEFQLKCSIPYNIEQSAICAEQGELTVFYEIKESDCMSPFFKVISGFQAALAISIGDYGKDLSATYKKLFCWAKQYGYNLANISYEEVILGFSTSLNSEVWVSRVYIPICGQSPGN